MELTDQLLHALLVACDQSYNPVSIDGMALQPYQDTPLGSADNSPAAMPLSWDADTVNEIPSMGSGLAFCLSRISDMITDVPPSGSERRGKVRLISARRATKHERSIYEEI